LKFPKDLKVSVGFASKTPKKAIGQCWNQGPRATKHVFVSPVVYDECGKNGVFAVLLHELIHACLPPSVGHKGPFKRAMKAVGLEGKPTATSAGDELREAFKQLLRKIGPYPHKALKFNPEAQRKQTTRLIKVGCQDCEYIARVTRKHLDESGPPICPNCEVPFEEM
jgi:predicted SprT family Zn-dependent metalloprotease